jgi:thioredoxin-related protein
MNASDAHQIVCRRKKERLFFEQSFHQTLFEKMKKHVKRISNEKSTQNLRNVDEEYHVKKNEIAQKFNSNRKILSLFT